MTKRSRKIWIGMAVLAVILLGLRLAMPDWVRDQLNSRMDRMGDYHGHIDEVKLRILAGAYTLQGVTVTKRTAEVPVPFFSGESIDIGLSWDGLFHGAVVAQVAFNQPELNFVDDRGDSTQAGTGVNWRQQLEELIPIRLNEVTIHDGTVHFRNFSTNPKVDETAEQVEGRLVNLTNIRDLQGRGVGYELTANLFGQAPLTFEGTADPFNILQDFHYKLSVTSMDLTNLNEVLQAYAKIDVESGTGTFLMELEAKEGQLDGYAKPLFKDIQVFSWKHDVEEDKDGPLRVLWEAFSGGIQNLFKNQKEDQFATRVEIHGELGNAETSTLQVIAGILKNAFVEAYRPRFENLPKRDKPEQDEAS